MSRAKRGRDHKRETAGERERIGLYKARSWFVYDDGGQYVNQAACK